jgi:hypothetical protein
MANQTASDQTMTNQSGADVNGRTAEDQIDQAREELQNNDTAKTLGELNSRFRTAYDDPRTPNLS